MGPLVSDEQFKRVTGYINSGIKEGAEALEEEGDEAVLDLGIIGAGMHGAASAYHEVLVLDPTNRSALDNVALVSYVLDKGVRTPLDIAVAGAITLGREGKHLAPMAEMAALGVRLFTDDGAGVQDPSLMRRAPRGEFLERGGFRPKPA